MNDESDVQGAAGVASPPPPTPPDASNRARRTSKPVERMNIAEPEEKELRLPKGQGTPLGAIENVNIKLTKLISTADELAVLHTLCFGSRGAKATIKKNLRLFSGFDSDNVQAEIVRKTDNLMKKDLALIKKALDVCDLMLKGTKAEAAARLVEFLSKPHPSGRGSLAEKAAKAGAKRKSGATSKASSTKKPAKKAVKKRNTGAPPRPKSAYLLYCEAKRAKVVAENPGASFAEVGKILGQKWAGISDERRTNYKNKAAELKAEYDAQMAKLKGSTSKPDEDDRESDGDVGDDDEPNEEADEPEADEPEADEPVSKDPEAEEPEAEEPKPEEPKTDEP